MNAVVTLLLGDEMKPMFAMTGPYMAEYAANIGAAFHVITQSPFAAVHPHFGKHEIGRLLDTYDRVLYLDLDIYVFPDCPDLFKMVPVNCVGIYDHATPTPENLATYHKEAKSCEDVLGPYRQEVMDQYYNAGVFVVSREHKALFSNTVAEAGSIYTRMAERGSWWPEQTLMNYRIRQLKFPVFPLDYRFNWRPDDTATQGKNRFEAYIVHFKRAINGDAMLVAKVAEQRRRLRDA